MVLRKESSKHALPGRKFASLKEFKERYHNPAVAVNYDSLRFTDLVGSHFNRRQTRIVNSILSRLKPRTLIDVGVGTGRLSFNLKGFERGIGVDSSLEMLKVAKSKKTAGWELVLGSGFELPFASSSTNCLMSTRVVWHFDKPSRERFFAEIRRVLSRGGYFIMDAPNSNAQKIGSHNPMAGKPSDVKTAAWRKSELEAELRLNGFTVVEWHGLLFGSRIKNMLRKLHLKRPGLSERLFVASEWLKFLEPSGWIVVCKKI